MAAGNDFSMNNSICGAMFFGGTIKNTLIQNDISTANPISKSSSSDDEVNLNPGSQINNSICGAVFKDVQMDNVHVRSKISVGTAQQGYSWDTVVPDAQGRYSYVRSSSLPLPEPTPVCSSGEAYQMKSYPYKGAAFILNNSYFPNLKNSERKGSDVDVQNAKELWKRFGFYVKTAENKSAEEMMEELSDFLALEKVTKTDCIVVMLMSHGGEGVLHGNDNRELNYSDIFSLFQPNNCPKLKGKPKMFFIQACRGKQVEVGIDIDARQSAGSDPNSPIQNDEEDADPTPASGGNSPIQDDEENAGDGSCATPFENCLKRPLPADFYIAHSTCDGFYSLRDKVDGSYFIQALCEVFYPLAEKEDLKSLMTKVSEKVSRKSGEVVLGGTQTRLMQQPQTHSTLNKKVYFKMNERL